MKNENVCLSPLQYQNLIRLWPACGEVTQLRLSRQNALTLQMKVGPNLSQAAFSLRGIVRITLAVQLLSSVE